MDEFRARRVVDSLRDRGVTAHLHRGGNGRIKIAAKKNGQAMTPQQRALVAELRAADYPAAWKLTASASDDWLAARASQQAARERSA
jgi:hypothetical protein